MLIGHPDRFAIESHITRAYARPGFLALGYFVLHVGGRAYGVRESDATLLAVAFDVVEERLAQRNTHQAAFATYPDGAALFDTLMASIYDDAEDVNTCCGVSRSKLTEIIEAQNLKWCDPDEAFDDGTTLFHFDEGSRVRLLATNEGDPKSWRHNPETFRDVWLDADEFYRVLQEWRDSFLAEWSRTDKIPMSEDRAESRA